MRRYYNLVRLKSSNHKDLTKCLDLYARNIEPLVRTSTNEIAYWLDNFKKRKDEVFYIFGFYMNNTLIGYAQIVHFTTEEIIFIDYLAIDKEFRRNNTFYEFIEHIFIFFKDNLKIKYVLAEVALFKRNSLPSDYAKTLIRLLKISGFNILKIEYYSPMLGKENFESETECALMIQTPNNELDKIKTETYLSFLKVIYFKHYQRWYEEFLNQDDMNNYNKSLYHLYQNAELQANKRKYIEINGMSNLFNKTPIKVPVLKNSKWKQLSLLVFLIFIISIVLGTGYWFINRKTGVEISTLSFIILPSSIVAVFILALVLEKKEKANLFEIIKSFFGKNQ